MDKRLVQLDFARGLAALLVCLGHLRAFTFVNFANVEHPTYFDRAFYFVTGFGHQSVIVFFVLSGFFVGGSVIEACKGGRWSWRQYGLRRLARLWVVLLPALALTWAWDAAGRLLTDGVGYAGGYHVVLSSGPSVALPALDDWTAFLGNAFFFQGIAVPTFGTNGVLWSLANEFWYYALFPLGFVAATANSIGSRVAQASLLVALLWWLPPGIVFPGLIWLFGCAAYVLTQRAPPAHFSRRAWYALLAALLFAASCYASRAGDWFGEDIVLGATFALLIPPLAWSSRVPVWYRTLACRSADVSYTLYLTHFPVLAFVFFVFMAPDRSQPDGSGFLLYAGLMAMVLAYASAMWWCFERNTDAVHRWTAARLQRLDVARVLQRVQKLW